MNKTCRVCNQQKSLLSFSKDRSKRDGIRSVCKQCDSKKSSEWYESNKEQANKTKAAWSQANKDKLSLYEARCYEKNREKYLQIGKTYYDQNRNEILEARRTQYKSNPMKTEITRAKTANRRARKNDAVGAYTRSDVAELMKKQRGFCACCRSQLFGKYHVDHVMPLALGGSNEKSNLQILCPPCNLSKGAKNPIEFMQSRGYLL